jgi:hypothetical protein
MEAKSPDFVAKSRIQNQEILQCKKKQPLAQRRLFYFYDQFSVKQEAD